MKKHQKGEATTSGIGVFGLLGILFIALKLTEVISWSWWWVLAPFWMPGAVVITILLAGLMIALAQK